MIDYTNCSLHLSKKFSRIFPGGGVRVGVKMQVSITRVAYHLLVDGTVRTDSLQNEHNQPCT